MTAKAEAVDRNVWTTTNVYYEMISDGTPRDVLVIEGYEKMLFAYILVFKIL